MSFLLFSFWSPWKFLLEKFFISPYTLLFLEGIFRILCELIIVIILLNVSCSSNNIFCNSSLSDTIESITIFFTIIKHNSYSLIYIGIYIIVASCLYVFRIMTIKVYSPIHRIIADCLVLIYSFIFNSIVESNFKVVLIGRMLLYLLILCFFLL